MRTSLAEHMRATARHGVVRLLVVAAVAAVAVAAPAGRGATTPSPVVTSLCAPGSCGQQGVEVVPAGVTVHPVAFGHDAFLNDKKEWDPAKAQAMIQAGVKNLEVDVGYRSVNGTFYVSHDGDANHIPIEQLGPRELTAVLKDFQFSELGLKPHFDIKFAASGDTNRLFDATLNTLAPTLDITLSGHDWAQLAELSRDPCVHRTLFTVDSQEKVALFVARAAELRQTVPGRVGVSLRSDLATKKNLALLRGHADAIVVWTVNDPASAAALVQADVSGITSDSRLVLTPLAR